MLRSIQGLIGYRALATDEACGTVKDMLFDCHEWTVRYLVLETGGWLSDRKVLIPQPLLGEPDWEGRAFPLELSKEQIESCPPLGADDPVSRQHETALLQHVALHPYWAGEPAAGRDLPAGRRTTRTPVGELKPAAQESPAEKEDLGAVCSIVEVTGDRLQATDGEIGGVEDFLVDDQSWKLRYVVVDTDSLQPRRRVLLAAPWIQALDHEQGQLTTDLSREEVKGGPEYEPGRPVNRDIEEVVYGYYKRPRYWVGKS